MSIALLGLMCVAFIELFILFKTTHSVANITKLAKQSYQVMNDDISDEDKEQQVQKLSLALFKNTFLFILKFALLVAIVGLIYWLAIRWQPTLENELHYHFLSWLSLIALTVFGIVYGWLRYVIGKRL